MPKKSSCKYCAAGHAPDEKGRHWIATGVGRVSVIACKALPPKASPDQQPAELRAQ